MAFIKKKQNMFIGIGFAVLLIGLIIVSLRFGVEQGLVASVKNVIGNDEDKENIDDQAVYLQNGEDDEVKDKLLVASFVNEKWQDILKDAKQDNEDWDTYDYKYKDLGLIVLQGKKGDKLSKVVKVQIKISEDKKKVNYKVIEIGD